jgi:hypothetical protein
LQRTPSGDELEAISKEVMVQPPEVIERVKKVFRKLEREKLTSPDYHWQPTIKGQALRSKGNRPPP